MNNVTITGSTFTTWDFMIPILFTVGYFVSVKDRNEYVLFFSTFFSWYSLLFAIWGIAGEYSGNPVDTRSGDIVFKFVLIPALLIYHLVYPFRKTKRNRRLTIFFAGCTLAIIGFFAIMWVGVMFSNM